MDPTSCAHERDDELTGATILVVDDDRCTLSVLERVLEKEGCTVLMETSGSAALAVVGRHHVDLMLLDLRMPGMDGLAVLKQIVSANRSLPVVMMTGYGHLETAQEARKLGACEYVTKPLSTHLLRQALRDSLRSSRVGQRAPG
ncbi:MAG: response regulator [Candidatus Riflebacteria bacterium]|nr:response regulator [Candidatus Riflebacteria bacterium]